MQIYLALALCLIQISCLTNATVFPERGDNVMELPKSRYQFIDRDMKVRIDAQEYLSAGSFSEGLARVLTKGPWGKYGYIDKSGQMVISPQFGSAGDFSEGLALVDVEVDTGSWRVGYIDTEGKVVIQTDFVQAHDFSEGFALAYNNDSVFLIHKDGEITTLFDNPNLWLGPDSNPGFHNGLLVARDAALKKYGYVDKSGHFVIPPQFENAASFSEGLARVSIMENGKELVGFIDIKGDFKIPPSFDVDHDFLRTSHDFSEGLAGIINGPPTMERDQYFIFINKDGSTAITTPFFYVGPFHEGLAVAYDSAIDRYAYIDKSGRQVVPAKFVRAMDFSEGLACVAISE